MAFSALRQCNKPTMQTPSSIRSLATGPAKTGMFRSFTASLGHAAAPIGVLAAVGSVALMIGVHTAWLHFIRSPSVHVTKTNRGSMPEVETPDVSISSGDKFVKNSFLRRVGQVQDKQYADGIEPGLNIYTRSRASDNLRTAGVIDKK